MKKNYNQDYLLQFKPLEQKVERGNFEDAFRKFKVKFQRERIIGLLKEHSSYEKPSEKKRRRRRQAHERRLEMAAREKMIESGEWAKRQKRKEAKRKQRAEARVKKLEEDG